MATPEPTPRHDERTVTSGQRARQGRKSGVARYVLGISTALTVVALILVYIFVVS